MTKHKLRICLISYRSNPHSGGQGIYIKNLSRNLKELGHSVDVISGPPDLILDNDIKIFRLPCLDLYNPDDLFRTPSIKELLNPINLIEWLSVSTMGFPEPFIFGIRAYKFLQNKFQNYDIIHDNQSLSYGIWAIKKRIPTITTIHHPITVDRRIEIKEALRWWGKLKALRWYSFISMQKQVAKTFSHIITVSECARNDICDEFSIPKENFRVIPNGINTELFYPIPEILREKNRIIVTNSADMPLKGLYYLLKAVAKISKNYKIRLIVIGTPKKNGNVVKLIKKLDIGSIVTFTGRIDNDEFVKQYAKASVAVIPSIYEGFGMPAGEAMACGIPVVSTTGGALPEVIGDSGVLVPPCDYEALAKAITDVLNNPEWAKKLGESGKKRVNDFFTWKKVAQKTVEVYKEVIDKFN